MKKYLLGLLFSFLCSVAAQANCVITSLPFNLTNGTVADASQVMANLNQIFNGVNNGCAAIGANSDITSLTGTVTGLAANAGQIGELKSVSSDAISETITFTNGSCNIGWPSDSPQIGAVIFMATTGALPTNFAASTNYYVISSTVPGGTGVVTVASSYAGSCISAGSAGSGTQTGANKTLLVTATAQDIVGLTLTAGDWTCSGWIGFLPQGTTTISSILAGLSKTTNTTPVGAASTNIVTSFTTGNSQQMVTALVDINTATTQNVFLESLTVFGVASMSADGLLRCRRIR